MTATTAYAQLVAVDRELDRFAGRPAMIRRHRRRYEALMAEWCRLQDVLDPEQELDYLDDITIFAPARATAPGQLDLFIGTAWQEFQEVAQ